MILVLNYAILETGLEFSDYSACLLEAVLFSVDSYILLHLVLHLGSDAGDLLPLLVFEGLVEYPLLLHHSFSLDRVSETGTVLFRCRLGCRSARCRAEDKA